MLELVDSGLYFVQDENNFISLLLQTGSGSGWPKINGSGRIRMRILIPAQRYYGIFVKTQYLTKCIHDIGIYDEFKH